MKKTNILIGIMFLAVAAIIATDPKRVDAYMDVVSFGRSVCADAVTVSTTPTALPSCLTVNRNELRLYKYGSEVIYMTFTINTSTTAPVNASSTTVAASGIKVAQSDEPNEYESLPISRDQTVYLTLAADSGTANVRKMEIGHY